jgi:hypothetical protein
MSNLYNFTTHLSQNIDLNEGISPLFYLFMLIPVFISVAVVIFVTRSTKQEKLDKIEQQRKRIKLELDKIEKSESTKSEEFSTLKIHIDVDNF